MPEPSDEQWKAIDADLSSGHKIRAIKLYRQITGEGLAEAKDLLEARQERLTPSSAESPGKARGCATVLGVVLCVGLSAAWVAIRMIDSTHLNQPALRQIHRSN
jgi:hypothetical protein